MKKELLLGFSVFGLVASVSVGLWFTPSPVQTKADNASVTDLNLTHWYFNETISAPTTPTYTYNVGFVNFYDEVPYAFSRLAFYSGGGNNLYTDNSTLPPRYYYTGEFTMAYSGGVSYTAYSSASGWHNEFYRDIYLVNVPSSAQTILLPWFQDNATYQGTFNIGSSGGGVDSSALSSAYNAGYSAGYSDGNFDGYDSGYGDGLELGLSGNSSAWQDGYDEGYADGDSAGYSDGYFAGYSDGNADGYSSGYDDGLDDGDYGSGYSAGYGAGYSSGFDDGIDYASNYDNQVFVEIDPSYMSTDRVFEVKYYLDELSEDTLVSTMYVSSSNPSVYFTRPHASIGYFSISSYGGGNPPFSVACAFSFEPNSSFVVNPSMAYSDGHYYLPYWSGDVFLTLTPDTNLYGDINSFTFVLDNDAFTRVGVTNAYTNGYNAGASDGYFSGYSDGNSAGYASGNSAGYASGYDDGHSAGYYIGRNEVDQTGQAMNNLFGAIVGIPISVLNGLSGLTIWSIPLISILLSFVFLAVVIWIVRKFY